MQTEVRVTPDQLVFFQLGFVRINATIVFSWAVMAILILASWLITRRLSTDPKVSRWQTLLEMMVGFIRQEIREVTQQRDVRFLFFLGSLFLFIAMSNLLTICPGTSRRRAPSTRRGRSPSASSSRCRSSAS